MGCKVPRYWYHLRYIKCALRYAENDLDYIDRHHSWFISNQEASLLRVFLFCFHLVKINLFSTYNLHQ